MPLTMGNGDCRGDASSVATELVMEELTVTPMLEYGPTLGADEEVGEAAKWLCFGEAQGEVPLSSDTGEQ